MIIRDTYVEFGGGHTDAADLPDDVVDRRVEGASYDFIPLVVRPVDTVYLRVVGFNARNRQRSFLHFMSGYREGLN